MIMFSEKYTWETVVVELLYIFYLIGSLQPTNGLGTITASASCERNLEFPKRSLVPTKYQSPGMKCNSLWLQRHAGRRWRRIDLSGLSTWKGSMGRCQEDCFAPRPPLHKCLGWRLWASSARKTATAQESHWRMGRRGPTVIEPFQASISLPKYG